MFRNYDVNKNGVVFNKKTGKIIKQWENHHGYMMVSIYINKKRKHIAVHRMVAIRFMGYKDGLVVNHIDSNTKNNHISNLEWCTQKENIRHAINKGRKTGTTKTILQGKKHRDISYYETHAIERRDFKRVCKARGENFEDFIEIDSTERTKSKNIKRFYIKKEK